MRFFQYPLIAYWNLRNANNVNVMIGTIELLEFKNKETSRGQILGFGLGLSAIIASVVCAYFGQTWVAIFVIGSTSLLGTIIAYIKFFSKANMTDNSN